MKLLKGDTVISASTVLCGEELIPVKDHSIIIRNATVIDIVPSDRIFRIAHNGEKILKDSSVSSIHTIDLKKYTVLPGLIDTHSHLFLDARVKNHLFMMETKECVQTVYAMKNIEDDLMAGITTVRSLGDRYHLDVALRDLVEKGDVIGPDLKVSGIGMKSIHGHGYVGKSYTGAYEYRKASRENLACGVDWLKIFITPGIPPLSGNIVPCFMAHDEIQAVVAEAHAVGKMVTAHCIGGEALHRCIVNGVDMIEHAYCVERREVDLMMNSDIKLCLTPGIFLDKSREAFCHKDLVTKVRKHRTFVAQSMKYIIDSGIAFSLGSDAYHGLVYKEALIVEQLGASIKTALQGITSVAAKHLGISHECGVIKKGVSANIIATKKNPLQQLDTLSDVSFVMKRGVVYKCEDA